MAKIGTAHIEIKPVIDEAALKAIEDRVAQAVAAGVARGVRQASPWPIGTVPQQWWPAPPTTAPTTFPNITVTHTTPGDIDTQTINKTPPTA